MQKNGYFQFGKIGSKLVLYVYPPEEGGEPVNQDELIHYLDVNKIEHYNLKEVSDASKNTRTKSTVILEGNPVFSFAERVEVRISADRMYAFLRFYPSIEGEGGRQLTKADILDALNKNGVSYGVKEEIIDQWIQAKVYCTNVPIAKGTPAVNGKDAVITYHFNTNRKAKPRLNEDGTVDFHQLDNIGHVKMGEALATLTPEDPGVPGVDVFGNALKPIKVNKKRLKYGKNIRLSEDGLQIISEVNGHAVLEDDKVFVSDVFEVPADVDNSTGDIEYEGNVYVKGNVRSGFKITASGNVEVDGVVEGAQIISGGEIVLKRGIQGMGKGLLDAKGNIIAKFIESAIVVTDGYVETDSIINSDVSAKTEIQVRGKKAIIIGGKARAGKLIEAGNIGSPSGTNTVVEVGTDPSSQKKLADMRNELNEMTSEKGQLDKIVELLRKKQDLGKLDQEKISLLQNTTKRIIMLGVQISEMEKRYHELESELQENVNAVIKVHKTAYSGAKVIVCGEYLLVQKNYMHCRFIKMRGEVFSSPL